jgi:hypothetical protein
MTLDQCKTLVSEMITNYKDNVWCKENNESYESPEQFIESEAEKLLATINTPEETPIFNVGVLKDSKERLEAKSLHVNFGEERCPTHKTVKAGYIQWHDWAQDQINKGILQTQCKDCGRWLFPEEM